MKNINIPNIITSTRILGAVIMLSLPYPKTAFLVLYTLCGISDVLDGMVARLTATQSEWGAKFDSVADLLFYAAMLIKIIPTLIKSLDFLVWIFAGIVILIRLSSYVLAAIKYRKFASQHTYLNKLTGFAVFCLPYLLVITDLHNVVAILVCAVGFLASLEEFILHVVSSNYDTSRKTLLFVKK